MNIRSSSAALCVAALLALAVPAAASAAHSARFTIAKFEPSPGHYEYLEDPCGVAVDSNGDLYVSDYYHDAIDIFSSSGAFIRQISGVDPSDGPCGLAVDSAGRIYVNAYHQGVLELTPGSYPPAHGTSYSAPQEVVSTYATGVAVDPAGGNLLVDERSSIAEYALPLTPGAEALRGIGVGTLEDGYGVAVSTFAGTAGYVYAADAADNTVKAYDPATSLTAPVATLDGQATALGRFNDLADAALAVDDSDGHLYLADNVAGPFSEHPKTTIEEFNSAGQLRGELSPSVIDGDPVGLAVDDTGGAAKGDLYFTDGNTEDASLLAFGLTSAAHILAVSLEGSGSGTVTSSPAGIRCGGACAAEFDSGSRVVLTAAPAPGSAFAGWSGACSGTGVCNVTMSEAETVDAAFELLPVGSRAAALGSATAPPATAVSSPASGLAGAIHPGDPSATASAITQKGGLRVSVGAAMKPRRLPRRGVAPVAVSVAGHVSTADGSAPPPLRRLAIEINRHGRFDFAGLPLCPLHDIQPASTARALAACRRSLVGQGRFEAEATLSHGAPYPTQGRLLLFNASEGGHPVLYGHIYSVRPFTSSAVIPFAIHALRRGTYGTELSADLAGALGSREHLTGIEMTLSRRWSSGGRPHSYISAGCPAPAGFPGVSFPLARVSFAFAGGVNLSSTVTGSCTVSR